MCATIFSPPYGTGNYGKAAGVESLKTSHQLPQTGEVSDIV